MGGLFALLASDAGDEPTTEVGVNSMPIVINSAQPGPLARRVILVVTSPVQGPISILGVGIAFGCSRKVRQRIERIERID